MPLYLLSVNHDMRSELIAFLLHFVRLCSDGVNQENGCKLYGSECSFSNERSRSHKPLTVCSSFLGTSPPPHVQATAAPSASASLLAYRCTSPRSPITVSRTTPCSCSFSSGADPAGEGAHTSSQRPKAQLRIHHCCCDFKPSKSAAAKVEGEGGAKRMKPFTRYTYSFGSWWRAAVSVGSSSGGGGCAVLDSSG